MTKAIILIMALLALGGCQGGNGEYAPPARGGWENFRA